MKQACAEGWLLYVVIAGLTTIGAPAFAAEYGRKSVAAWNDPFTPPQTRTRCISMARGDWPWGGEWKTCKEWATDTKWMRVEIFAKTIGPDGLAEAAKKAVEVVAQHCGQQAALAGIVVLAGTPTPDLGTRMAVAWPAALATFNKCLAEQAASLLATNVAINSLKLAFEPSSHWTPWSNEMPQPVQTPPASRQGMEHLPGTIVFKDGSYKNPQDGKTYIVK